MHQFSNQIQFSVIIQHVIVAFLVFLVPSAVRHGHPPPNKKKKIAINPEYITEIL